MVGPSISAYSSLQQMLVVSDGVVIFLGPSNTSYVNENHITREGRGHSKYYTVKGKDIKFLGFKTPRRFGTTYVLKLLAYHSLEKLIFPL